MLGRNFVPRAYVDKGSTAEPSEFRGRRLVDIGAATRQHVQFEVLSYFVDESSKF
jgi:hypothetical protein